MEIAKYVASFAINIQKTEIAKVDKELARIEKKVKAFSKNMGGFAITLVNFKVNQRNLSHSLGTALDAASSSVVFEVKNFVVDQARLNSVMSRAVNLSTNSIHPTINPHITTNARQPSATSSSKTTRNAVAGGMIGGGLSRMYGPIAALAMGGYGLASLNKRNQAVQSAELTAEAVASSNGLSEGAGRENFEWLKKLARKTGFSYMENAQNYNSFMANSLGMGETTGESQKMFKGIAEYSRVMHVDKYHQKLIFNAFDRMLGKGKVGSLELTKELGSYLPGAKSIFAQAWQEKTGGKLTGQPAIEALTTAMKAGLVNSKEVVPMATRIMEERAAPTIEHASHTSQSEQANMDNTINDLAVIANKSGVEEGFARIFSSISTGLEESNGLIVKLAEGFNEATVEASKLLLFPQSFIRALDGRDSLVADWLGTDKTTQMIEDWSQIKVLFDDIAKSVGSTEWSPSLKSTADEIAQIMHGIAEFQVWKQRTGDTAQQINQDEYDAGGGSGLSQFKGILKSNWHTFKNTIMPWSADERNAEYGAQRLADSGANTDAFMGESGLDTKAYWKYTQDQARDSSFKQFGGNSYGVSVSEASELKSSADTFKQSDTQEGAGNYKELLSSITKKEPSAADGNTNSSSAGDQPIVSNTNTFYMDFHLTGEPAVMEDWFRTSLTKEIEKVMPNLPEK